MPVLSTKFKLVDDMSDKLKSLGTAGQDIAEELKNIGTSASSLEKVSDGAEKVTQTITETSDAVREYNEWHEKSIDALTDYINGVEGSEEELNKYTDTTKNASEETDELGEKLKGTQQEHQKTQEEIERTTKKTQDYGNTNKEFFDTLENLIATAGIIAFLKKVYDGYTQCIEAATTYETSIAKVSTLADPSQMSIGDMSNDLLELSQKTGQAASDLADAEYQALSAGIATKSASEFVEQANQLAVGGFTEAATAVDVLTTALNAYQLDVSETERVSDTLITTQNLGKTTVDELARQMGRVIPSAAAYNVEIEDLSTAYATLTANGIATAESTTYLKGMLNELGSTNSAVSATLQEETGKTFAMLIEDGSSLGDIIGILSDSVDGNATAFANLWSSQEAGIGALSLLTSGTEKYNDTLEKMENSTGTAAEAYETMTETSEHTAKAVQTAGTNLQIAIGDAMLPATNKFNEAWANTLNGLTTFVKDHPGAVQATSAIAVGIGVVTAAVVGYTAVTKLATVATAALKAVTTALSSPVFLVVTAITAIVAGLTTFIATQEEAVDEMDGMSASTKLQHERLQELNAEYDEMCEKEGENSTKAQLLKAQYDELSASYENNKQTMQEFKDSCEEAAEEFNQIHDEYYKGKENIDNEEEATGNLIDRLDELASKSSLTANEQAEMVSVIDILNSKMPSLGLTYEQVAKNADNVIEKLKALSTQSIAQDRYENAQKSYNDLLSKQPELLKQTKEAEKQAFDAQTLHNEKLKELTQAQKDYDEAVEKYGGDDQSGKVSEAALKLAEAQGAESTALEDYNTALETFNNVKGKYNQNLRDSEDALETYTDAFAEKNGIIIDKSDEMQQAISSAALNVEGELQELATAYDDAYNSALSSIQGQYTLWDNVDEVSATSVTTLMSNLDSQISYWQNYSDNLESLQNRNIEGLDELLASMDDGSEESAAALAGMATASDDELRKMVTKYTDLQGEQDKTAKNTAELQTEFGKKMDGISDKMKSTVDSMDLSAEAKTAAKSTIDSYIAEIQNGQSRASSAMATVVAAAKAQLSTNNSSPGGSSSTPKHARGTSNAEDVFIAGEEGPELVVGHAGATVYTAEETRQIFNQNYKIADTTVSSSNPDSSFSNAESYSYSNGERVVTIKLEGVGSIRVSGSGSVSKDEIVDVMTEKIKPVLVGILNNEIYEEGDDTYEY